MKLSLSASSGIVKSSEADIAEPGTDESRRQRRGRFYRRLALALHPNGQGVEQHREIGRASCRGKSVSVRVDLGGRRIIKKKKYRPCQRTTTTTISHNPRTSITAFI